MWNVISRHQICLRNSACWLGERHSTSAATTSWSFLLSWLAVLYTREDSFVTTHSCGPHKLQRSVNRLTDIHSVQFIHPIHWLAYHGRQFTPCFIVTPSSRGKVLKSPASMIIVARKANSTASTDSLTWIRISDIRLEQWLGWMAECPNTHISSLCVSRWLYVIYQMLLKQFSELMQHNSVQKAWKVAIWHWTIAVWKQLNT